MTDKTAFEQWWHEKCETDFTFPNESSFISHIAKQAWNDAIDAAIDQFTKIDEAKTGTNYEFIYRDCIVLCLREIQKLRSE